MNEAWRPRRVFIFYPGMNERTWRVMWRGEAQSFNSEGRAVEFAMTCAAKSGGGRLVEIVQETASGGWRPIAPPLR
jgi:hypothetical protein